MKKGLSLFLIFLIVGIASAQDFSDEFDREWTEYDREFNDDKKMPSTPTYQRPPPVIIGYTPDGRPIQGPAWASDMEYNYPDQPWYPGQGKGGKWGDKKGGMGEGEDNEKWGGMGEGEGEGQGEGWGEEDKKLGSKPKQTESKPPHWTPRPHKKPSYPMPDQDWDSDYKPPQHKPSKPYEDRPSGPVKKPSTFGGYRPPVSQMPPTQMPTGHGKKPQGPIPPWAQQGGQMPPGPGQMPPGPGQMPPRPGQMPPGPGQMPPGPGQMPPGPGQMPPGPGQMPPGPGQWPPGPGQMPPGSGTPRNKPAGQMPPEPEEQFSGPETMPPGPGQGQMPPGLGRKPRGPGQMPPGPSQFPSGPGQMPPEQEEEPEERPNRRPPQFTGEGESGSASFEQTYPQSAPSPRPSSPPSRPTSTPSRPSRPPAPTQTQELPDLVVNPFSISPSIEYMEFTEDECYIQEGCVKAPGNRKLLRFTTEVINAGNVPIDLGEPGANNPNFHYDSCRRAYLRNDYNNYTLTDMRDNVVVNSIKQGYCLLDSGLPSGTEGTGEETGNFDCDKQGLSAGFADAYAPAPGYKDCQWVDITGVPNGRYVLTIEVNANHAIEEGDYDNNTATITIVIAGDNVREID